MCANCGQYFMDADSYLDHASTCHNPSYDEDENEAAHGPVTGIHANPPKEVWARRVQKNGQKSEKKAKLRVKKAQIIEEKQQSE